VIEIELNLEKETHFDYFEGDIDYNLLEELEIVLNFEEDNYFDYFDGGIDYNFGEGVVIEFVLEKENHFDWLEDIDYNFVEVFVADMVEKEQLFEGKVEVEFGEVLVIFENYYYHIYNYNLKKHYLHLKLIHHYYYLHFLLNLHLK